MFERIRNVISRTAAMAGAAAAAALSTVRAAFAASTDATSALPPEYSELLRLAQEKVQAATQPGAFGNGTPLIGDAAAMLPWVAIAACAAAGTAVIAAKVLKSRIRGEAMLAQ